MSRTESGISECSVGELKSAFESGSDVVVIDVRDYPEYAASRIPGARLIPLKDIGRRASEIDSTRPVYVVCRTGRRSAQASQILLGMGFGDVRNVGGGMVAWRQIGGQVERDARPPWSIERQVRFAAGLLVLTGILLGVWVSQPFIWLAAFVGGGLAFAALTDTCAMGNLLARMPWNRQS